MKQLRQPGIYDPPAESDLPRSSQRKEVKQMATQQQEVTGRQIRNELEWIREELPRIEQETRYSSQAQSTPASYIASQPQIAHVEFVKIRERAKALADQTTDSTERVLQQSQWSSQGMFAFGADSQHLAQPVQRLTTAVNQLAGIVERLVSTTLMGETEDSSTRESQQNRQSR